MLVGGSEGEQRGEGGTITVLDDVLTWIIGRLGMGPAMLLGAAIYAAIGLVLPLSFDWHGPLLVVLNVLGVTWGWLITVVWLISRVQAAQRRHLLEWTTSLRLLTAEEFEWIVGEVCRREGWYVEETGHQGAPDGNVDLRIRRGKQERLVQCKSWTSKMVGVDEVRKLAGTLMREGLHGEAGILVTLSDFTEQAAAEAAKLGIELVDNRKLMARIANVRASERTMPDLRHADAARPV
jgi:hypothetical protein